MKTRIRKKSGKQYLYADISFSGFRVKSSLGISVHSGRFNQKTEQVENCSDDVEINELINRFKIEIQRALRQLQLDNDISTHSVKREVELIKSRLTDPKHSDDDKTYLLPYAQRHILRSTNVKKPNTIKQYRTCYKHLTAFERTLKKRISFDCVNH
ncbi:Arm DNA-binding domain-containing protein [Sanyastnella coralliicola]|uniref:Arm DNA-binding domain-containing protein n=1 Tax=Sanyastnella coralliicola TaxID=3069118 RepID=UPI0033130804